MTNLTQAVQGIDHIVLGYAVRGGGGRIHSVLGILRTLEGTTPLIEEPLSTVFREGYLEATQAESTILYAPGGKALADKHRGPHAVVSPFSLTSPGVNEFGFFKFDGHLYAIAQHDLHGAEIFISQYRAAMSKGETDDS